MGTLKTACIKAFVVLEAQKMAEIKIDDSMILFGRTPKFFIGQRVAVEKEIGYVVGVQRGKYSWLYLVVEGDPPQDDSSEDWYEEHKVSDPND